MLLAPRLRLNTIIMTHFSYVVRIQCVVKGKLPKMYFAAMEKISLHMKSRMSLQWHLMMMLLFPVGVVDGIIVMEQQRRGYRGISSEFI